MKCRELIHLLEALPCADKHKPLPEGHMYVLVYSTNALFWPPKESRGDTPPYDYGWERVWDITDLARHHLLSPEITKALIPLRDKRGKLRYGQELKA